MIGVQNDFQMHSGNSRVLEFTIRDEDDAVIDIASAAIRWELAKADSKVLLPTPKGSVLVAKAVASGITITDGPNGRCDVQIDEADTEALKGDHYHELRVVLAGETSTASFGKVEILLNLVE